MRIAVVGPGALGCLFAAKLTEAEHTVTLVDHRPERAGRLRKSGIAVESGGTTAIQQIDVDVSIPAGQDFILVLTKAYSTPALRFPADTAVLTLQNGLGNVEQLCTAVGSARLLAGVTSEAATLLDEGRVRHAAAGQTFVGSWTSCSPDSALKALRSAGFDVSLTEAPGQMLWEKTAINAGINPLTALLDVPNGRLLELREIRQLMRNLVVEAAKVAGTEGYRFEHSLVERAEEVCRETGDNISSMLQDIRNHKRTEIEAISGEIWRRAQAAYVPAPRTRTVYQLIRGLEDR